MSSDSEMEKEPGPQKSPGFIRTFLTSLARDALKLVIAFGIGTGAGAIVCWYYGIPLVFSLLGGILVLGLAVAFRTEGLFS
jgi:hypothetical protein